MASKSNQPNKPFQPKTLAQNKKIWALKEELYLSEDNLRDVVSQVTQERSISRLSLEQASKVIDLLEGFLRKQKRATQAAKAKSGNVIQIANKKQQAMIRILAGKVKWRYEDGFQRFLKTRLNMSAIKTNEDVTTVKKALENIIDCQSKNKEAQPDE